MLESSPAAPSFLFLLIDDVGWGDLSYNNGIALTPHIDRWTQDSGTIPLMDFHSGGTVCSPTRATVLTGRNHFRDCVDFVYGCNDMSKCVPNFEFAPSHTFTVGDAVRAANLDHKAFFGGKWHLGSFFNDSEAYGGKTSSPTTHGFDHYNATIGCAPTYTTNCQCKAEWEDTCHFGHYNNSFHFCETPHGDPNHCCFNYWWDDASLPHGVANMTSTPTEPDDALYLVDAFSHFLEERHAKEHAPFLSQISFHNCHIPFIGSDEAVASCARNETCRPPQEGAPYSAQELDFYACLNQLDVAVGRVLDLLKSSGYYNNTMVWFASDNGPEMNCPPLGFCKGNDPQRPEGAPGSAGRLRGRKRDVYEGGHRVPGIVSWPAVISNNGARRASWETITSMDYLPTIMDILNVSRPPEQQKWAMDGRSILPILQGKQWKDTKEGEREVGWGFLDPKLSKVNGWGYRHGRYKLVLGSRSCQEESCRKTQLFDLETDLGERHDLAEELPNVLAHMNHSFYEWHKSVLQSRLLESKCTRGAAIGGSMTPQFANEQVNN